MKLYSYWRSSSAWRVRTMLAWKGIDHTIETVDLAPEVRAQAADGFEQVNALRQVPVLEWREGGTMHRLTQSIAIAEWLEERQPAPPLLPADALSRARVRELVNIVASGIQPLQNTGVLADVRALGGAEAAASWARSAIARGLLAVEAHARAHGGGCCVGEAVTLADVFLVPQLYNARRFGVPLEPYPTLVAIEARVSALPAFAAAHPDRQPDAPARGGEP